MSGLNYCLQSSQYDIIFLAVGLGIGCTIAGLGMGFALKAAWKCIAGKLSRVYRPMSPSTLSTATTTTVVNDPTELNKETPSSSSAAVLQVDPPIMLNPLYQTRFPSEVSLYNRVEKKQR